MFNWFKKKQHIWQTLAQQHPQGIMALAPMADVTDNAFRKILAEVGAPDLYYTEFVAADGLAHPDARDRLMQLLTYEKNQRPIVAQVFSHKRDNLRDAAALVQSLGFDGIDLNMGCPQRTINKQICGAELIKPEHRHLVTAAVEALREGAPKLPISLKTRIGYHSVDMGWIEFVLGHKPEAFLIHLRTKKEMSKVPAHWELMDEIKAIRDRVSPETVLIGNGDVLSVAEGREKCQRHGIDGVLIGRGLFHNPWLFDGRVDPSAKTAAERIELALRHTRYFEQQFGATDANMQLFGKRSKNFNLMKKFYKIYIQGFDGAKELRVVMMGAKDKEEVERLCADFLASHT